MFAARIEGAIKEALGAMGAADAHFVVERPSLEHGDYASNAPLTVFGTRRGEARKRLDESNIFSKQAAKNISNIVHLDPKFRNPNEFAKALAEKLDGKIEGIEKIEVVGGFLNFSLSREALLQAVQSATQEKWGKNDLQKGKTIMVEYTDPNPFKEFHIGHLMSNAIGESIARLLEYSGAKVLRANYQGDVGPHVAKAIWGKMQKPDLSWGEAYAYGAEQYEAHKAEIDSLNKKIYEKSDIEVNKLYGVGREESLKHFEKLYQTLGTKFDFYFFESDVAPRGVELVKKHQELFEQSEGATVFRGKHTRVFVTSQGLPTYEAKELGLAELKQEKARSDMYITVTASEQSGFFDVVFETIVKIFPNLAGKLIHRAHGHMRFAEGKMSSRTGNVIIGESLLEDLQKAARGRQDVAVGAIKYAVLKQGSGKDIIFDPEKSLSLEGDSGPYLQYAHTRAFSLLREAKKAKLSPGTADAPKAANVLERILIHFPHVLARAAQELEPHYVTTYLTELSSAFNSWYANERVIGGKNPTYGVLLTQAVETALAKGLHVLGIPAPEEM